LMPIFLGFIGLHFMLIVAGIFGHSEGVSLLVPEAVAETKSMASEVGWLAVLALLFKAFSLGGGTYTGIEAVSNSMHHLAEPKVRTGKMTMIAIAASLAFMACGIIMLYLLWDVEKVAGETLNATAFKAITADWHIGDMNVSGWVVGVTMIFSAGLLFVAGNAGFIAGPAVLANMAIDRWMPHSFSLLSNRLVTKNGILLMGFAAAGALLITGGQVHLLVVLYSINVFLTFSLSLAGLSSYRWRKRRRKGSLRKLIIPFVSLIICVFILGVTIFEKFTTGGWITIFVTGGLIALGFWIRKQYDKVACQVRQTEEVLAQAFSKKRQRAETQVPEVDPEKPTAVFIIDETAASGLHTLLWVQREFPRTYTNFIFASVAEFDTEELVDDNKWRRLNVNTTTRLQQYVDYCHDRGIPSKYYHAFSIDVAQRMEELADQIAQDYPRATFFGAKVISDDENFFTQLLHNKIIYILQKRLHNRGKTMIIMPMKL
ncbi:MAG: APC family permease, partial [Alphaproteobacteria bacterium]|nr:APC family permease [Alphaproteobacteria bacterium]